MRAKNLIISFRVNEREKNYFTKKFIESKKRNIREYILTLLDHQKIIIIDINQIAKRVQKIGVNINQIAKQANTSRNVSSNEINAVTKELISVWQLLTKLRQETENIMDESSYNT